MLRQMANDTDHLDTDFEWRGREVSRIENLSDIVFAISLGMLVSASEVPTNFDELNHFLLGIVPVTLGFVMMLRIWSAHFTYFRRYAFTDRKIIALNSMLLLLVLFIAYPLRFVFDSLFGFTLGLTGQIDRLIATGMTYQRSGIVMGYFTAGFAAIYTLFALMYGHALRSAAVIGLSADERTLTKQSVLVYWSNVVIAVAAFCAAVLTPLYGFGGFILLVALPVSWALKRIVRPRASKKESSTEQPDEA